MLADLHESGIIEHYADVVISLYRDSYYNEQCENPFLAEAIALKNRKGAAGTVQLNWLQEYIQIRHGCQCRFSILRVRFEHSLSGVTQPVAVRFESNDLGFRIRCKLFLSSN